MHAPLRPLASAFLASGLLVSSQAAHAQANDLQAGGLAPPAPSTGPGAWSPQPTETERRLREADEEDSGRGLEIAYFDVEGGGQYLTLEGLAKSGAGLLPSAPGAAQVRTRGFGAMTSAGAGVRLVFLTVGPRFRYATFSDWNLWSLGGEVGLHIPLGNLEPHVGIGAGYTKLVHPVQAMFGPDAPVSIGGVDVRLTGGADYYLTNVFSVGARAGVEMLFLSRASVDPGALTTASTGPEREAAELYAESGSGIGFSGSASLVLGLHF